MSCIDVILLFTGTLCGRKHVDVDTVKELLTWGFFPQFCEIQNKY